MKKVQPYAAVGPQVTNAPLAPSVVTSAPNLDTRRKYGTGAFAGLLFNGGKGSKTQTGHPYAGQGLVSPVFPLYQSSRVSSDQVADPILTARNYMSPIGHRNVLSDVLPVPASLPVTEFTNQNRAARGTGGNFTIPANLNVNYWPTSTQWLESRGMVR